MTDGLDNCVRELVRMGEELHRTCGERNQARAEAEKYRAALEKILEPTGLDAAPAYAELRRIAREALRK